MLFSEPKIPQSWHALGFGALQRGFSALQRAENSSIDPQLLPQIARSRFSALQRAENSSILAGVAIDQQHNAFQCSSASRKFLNERREGGWRVEVVYVSVLFSEPKIPQSGRGPLMLRTNAGFSALQRAENSSIHRTAGAHTERSAFQCSSASRKFHNPSSQRLMWSAFPTFQCSSASRKFLNLAETFARLPKFDVSVLFSEPKIPQFISYYCRRRKTYFRVSVLFSEPKIPQCCRLPAAPDARLFRFSALQRAENSSMGAEAKTVDASKRRFSALQRAENSSILPEPTLVVHTGNVSVLFSEPKIPQWSVAQEALEMVPEFQCSSASRKFLNSSECGRPATRRPCFSALQRAENSSMTAASLDSKSR